MKMFFIAPTFLPFQPALRQGAHTLAISIGEAWIRHTGIHIKMESEFSPMEQSGRVQAWSDRGYGPRCVEVSEFVVDESEADVLGNRKNRSMR